jgi:hypothetical protein
MGRLYAVGRAYHARRGDDGAWQMSDEPLGLQVVDPSTGSRLASIDSDASRVALTSDGDWLLLTVWGDVRMWTQVLPIRQLDESRPLEAWDLVAGVSLEGAPVVVGLSAAEGPMRVARIDPATLSVGPRWLLGEPSTILIS